jgi:two-component system, response regulator PdtaR
VSTVDNVRVTAESENAGGALRVLICEDEGLTVLRLSKALGGFGYTVAGTAGDGVEAVQKARDLKPDVILMDVRMPRMDGIEATRRIMADRPSAILMITAFSDQELVRQALDAGASGYLVKPVSDEQLVPAITVARERFAQFTQLHEDVSDLREALEARKLVDRARGILMQRRKMTEEEAYRQLQKVSRDRRQSLKQTAQQVIAAAELLD